MAEMISGATGTGNVSSSRQKVDIAKGPKKNLSKDMPVIPIRCMNPRKRKNVKTKNQS